MSSMIPVYHFIAYGSENQELKIETNICNENMVFPFHNFDNYFLYMPHRNRESFSCKSIAFELTENMSENQFNELIKDAYFELEIGGQSIIKHKLSFYTKLHPIKIIDNKVMITLPLNYFIGEIYLAKLQYNEVKLRIGSIQNMDLVSNINFYGAFKSYRERIHSTNAEILIQNVQSKYIELEEPENELSMKLIFNNICRGYFIEAPINKLQRFKLIINNTTRIDYDELMLNEFCKKVSDNLIYIPFDDNFNYMDLDENKLRESYRYGINQTRLDIIKFQLNFSEPVNNIGIHSLTSNKFKYQSGMGNLHFVNGTGYTIFNQNNVGETIKSSSKYSSENRLINMEKNSSCPINYDEFSPNCKYLCCHQCKTNFSENGIIQWFNSSGYKCPTCRTSWKNYIIYTNRE